MNSKPKEACGVFGAFVPGTHIANLIYFGLFALQHRGQESAGIAVSNGHRMTAYKNMGLLSAVFDENTLAGEAPHGRALHLARGVLLVGGDLALELHELVA